MDQLIVLVVVGALALAKWLFENAGKFQGGESDDNPPNPAQPPRPLRPDSEAAPRSESEEERMRRFMEALGLPQSSVPPPVRKPVVRPPPRPAEPVSKPLPTPRPSSRNVGYPISPSAPARRPKIAPPLETGGPLPTLPKTASVGETAPSMEVTSIPQMTFAAPEQAVQSSAAEVSAAAKSSARPSLQKQQTTGTQAALREQLRDPASLRKAILLREILGAPKGLQSAQSPSIFSPL